MKRPKINELITNDEKAREKGLEWYALVLKDMCKKWGMKVPVQKDIESMYNTLVGKKPEVKLEKDK